MVGYSVIQRATMSHRHEAEAEEEIDGTRGTRHRQDYRRHTGHRHTRNLRTQGPQRAHIWPHMASTPRNAAHACSEQAATNSASTRRRAGARQSAAVQGWVRAEGESATPPLARTPSHGAARRPWPPHAAIGREARGARQRARPWVRARRQSTGNPSPLHPAPHTRRDAVPVGGGRSERPRTTCTEATHTPPQVCTHETATPLRAPRRPPGRHPARPSAATSRCPPRPRPPFPRVVSAGRLRPHTAPHSTPRGALSPAGDLFRCAVAAASTPQARAMATEQP
jgi:hypothetical protein